MDIEIDDFSIFLFYCENSCVPRTSSHKVMHSCVCMCLCVRERGREIIVRGMQFKSKISTLSLENVVLLRHESKLT